MKALTASNSNLAHLPTSTHTNRQEEDGSWSGPCLGRRFNVWPSNTMKCGPNPSEGKITHHGPLSKWKPNHPIK